DPVWKLANPWHYVNFSQGDKYNAKKRSKKGDVIWALRRFEGEMQDKKIKMEQRQEALKFFIHMFADLHQPLHVGFAADRGGNKIKVKWFKDSANLHSVWDTWMIQYQNLSYTEYTAFLDHFSNKELKEWQQGDYEDFAYESRKLVRKIYQDKHLDKLGYDYNFKYKAIMEQRMRQAGVRMADRLNLVFGR
ncbi:MAG: S1/P1 nuclease, partial [Bdellovibrionales bacterium]|nr:S1/P1 nuclease [Bdellovibrionales bacterium]